MLSSDCAKIVPSILDAAAVSQNYRVRVGPSIGSINALFAMMLELMVNGTTDIELDHYSMQINNHPSQFPLCNHRAGGLVWW